MSSTVGFWHSSGTHHFPKCLSTTTKEFGNVLGQVLHLVSHERRCFWSCPLCSSIALWVISEGNCSIILSCRSLFIHHELWLTSGGVSGVGRQETPGQHRSGWRLKTVRSLVIFRWSSGHSVMRRLFAHAQTWKTENSGITCDAFWGQTSLSDLDWRGSSCFLFTCTFSRLLQTQCKATHTEENDRSAWRTVWRKSMTSVYTSTQSHGLRMSRSTRRPWSIITQQSRCCSPTAS